MTISPFGERRAAPASLSLCLVAALLIAAAPVAAQPLDVDGSGPPVLAPTDLVYAARRVLMLPPVPASFRDLDPTIPADAAIVARIDAIGSALDVDGNGSVEVFDVAYCARVLLRLPPVPPGLRAGVPPIPSDEAIAARCHALLADQSPSPTPTPSPLPEPATTASPPCGAAGQEPCVQGASASPSPRPCAAKVLSGAGDIIEPGDTSGGSSTLGSVKCGTKGGGAGAPERVYEIVAPAAGTYDIAVQGLGSPAFAPVIHARRESCQGAFIGCAVGSGVTNRPALTVELAAMERIAIVVDGNGAGTSGPFTLSIAPRLPDLRVRRLALPAQAIVGAPLAVELEIENTGDLDAGSFVAEVQYFRDGTLAQPLGSGPATCRIASLPAKAVTDCRFDVALTAPFVAAGDYTVGVIVDAQREVRERGDAASGANGANNSSAATTSISVPGAVLDQQVFRAADGTAYQLVRALPSADATAAEHFRLTALAAASNGVRACAIADSFPGGTATVHVGAAALSALASVERTAVLEPGDVALRFEPTAGGRLTLGRGATPIEVCRSCPAGTPLSAMTAASGGLPAACLAEGMLAGCDGPTVAQTIGFGVQGDCSDPAAVTLVSEVCREEPEDGFVLAPGQGVVFVHHIGLGPFDVGIAGFGIDLDEQNQIGCTARQVVDARAIGSNTGRQPLLTFVEAQNKRRFDFSSVIVSGDGADVYVGDGSGQVLRYDRNLSTGSLALAQTVEEGEGGVGGLTAAAALALSPDGRHLFVASGCRGFCNASDEALAVFARDVSSGALSFVQTLRDGVGGVDGLAEASAVAVSPDGAHVYVAGTSDDAVAVFARDGATGRLSFVEAVRGSPETPGLSPDDLAGPRSIAISGSGANVYVACSRSSAATGTVVAFSRAADSGRLTPLEVIASAFRPVGVALGPADGQLYVASGIVFRSNPNTTDGVWIFTRDPQLGTLTFLDALGDAAGEVGGIQRVRAVALSPDGGTLELLAAPLVSVFTQAAQIAVFTRNPLTGRLVLADIEGAGLSGIFDNTPYSFGFAISPDGAQTYVVGGTSTRGVIAVAGSEDGFVTPADGPEGLARAEAGVMSGNGDNLYVGSEEDGALVTFVRDPATGRLTAVDVLADGFVSALAVAPDDGQVYSLVNDAIRRYTRDADTGRLLFQGETVLTAAAEDLGLSPNGAHAYVVTTGAVSLYARNAATGALSFVETLTESAPGNPLSSAGLAAVRVSPDGAHVYLLHRPEFVESDPDGNVLSTMSISVLRRHASTGRLTFVETRSDGGIGPEGLVGSAPIVISADGAFVYVSRGTFNSGAVEVYGRNASTGRLSFIEVHRTGIGAASGFKGSKGLALSVDGAYLFVAGGDSLGFGDGGDDALVVFARNATTGRLTYLEQQRNGVGRVEGIDGPAAVVPSPDGRHVYVVSDIDNGVALFAVNQ